jgi:hypothetical protein
LSEPRQRWSRYRYLINIVNDRGTALTLLKKETSNGRGIATKRPRRFGLDVWRLATSHFLAVQDRLGETLERAVQLTLAGLRAYLEAVRRLLKKGKDLNLDVSETQPSGSAAVDKLVRDMAGVKRPAFVGKLKAGEGGHRRLVRTADYFNVTEQEREQALRLLADYRKRFSKKGGVKEGFFDVEDVCGRVSDEDRPGIKALRERQCVPVHFRNQGQSGRRKEPVPRTEQAIASSTPPALLTPEENARSRARAHPRRAGILHRAENNRPSLQPPAMTRRLLGRSEGPKASRFGRASPKRLWSHPVTRPPRLRDRHGC